MKKIAIRKLIKTNLDHFQIEMFLIVFREIKIKKELALQK